ncbi:MAG: hypothetical protein HY813_00160 [Candidatus Portnoybacteria bacterium]|nr:hypothetical protein [Candidatus Portnoybacteria bacterium]
MFNPHQTILDILEGQFETGRTKDVILRRFGLTDGRRQTLESVGRDYGITRERVRQIESNGLKALSGPEVVVELKPAFEMIKNHLSEHGDLKREERLLDDLVCVCEAKPGRKALAEGGTDPNFSKCRAALYLMLVLGELFVREKEDETLHTLWTIDKKSVSLARNVIGHLTKYLKRVSKVTDFKILYDEIDTEDYDLDEKALAAYLGASKEIDVNKFGEYGLIYWPEISPRGVRDKAYLILRKYNKPLHFSEITDLINRNNLDQKTAQVETVHNELIKDQRFILIGRGIYALSEWGYEPGTVTDIIIGLLKKHGSLSKEEILEKVLEKRMIKENTVLINLQDRKYFIKNDNGRYNLLEAVR